MPVILVQAYLLFNCAKLWVQGLEVVSKTALSVHSGLEVSQCHFAKPVRDYFCQFICHLSHTQKFRSTRICV